MVPINENYKDYAPPRAVRRSVHRLVKWLHPGHLTGIQAIVLTNAATLGKGKTRRVRGRKYAESACLGFYHRSSQHNGPWIQLVVDNIVRQAPRWFLRSRYLTDMLVAKTLFHEVGHHLDGTVGSRSRSGEEAAEDWSRRLRTQYSGKRYRMLSAVLGLLTRLFRHVFARQIAEGRAVMKSAGRQSGDSGSDRAALK